MAFACWAPRLFQVVCVLDIMHLDHVDVVQPQALQRLCHAAPPAASESVHVHARMSDSEPNLGALEQLLASISLASSPLHSREVCMADRLAASSGKRDSTWTA